MCSGQFVTQKPMSDDDDAESASQGSQSQDASQMPSQTPDTVILTKDLTQNLSRQDTQQDKMDKEKDTQDTVLMSSEEFKFQEEERAPGFMEEYPGFLDSSDDEGERVTMNCRF
jgi:rhamnose utilization protein RhaD (predicted bifunctional aldolase and dehydrogenase)